MTEITVTGDEKHERFQYATNASAWIVSKVSNYTLYAADNATKVRQALSHYDNLALGYVGSTGALTRAESWLDTSLQQPETAYDYDSHGNVVRQTDSLGRESKTYYGLRDETFTFPDRAVNALDHATDAQYDPGTGNLLWTERNGIRTSFAYDVHGRISKEVQPYDTAQSPTRSYAYSLDGTAPESVRVSQRTTANNTLDTHYLYDGFGQLVQVRSPADGGQQVVVNVFYDASGRVNATSNPYFESWSTNLSTPSSTVNLTIFHYDALDRPVKVTNPDGTTLNTTFDRWNVTAWDPSGHRIQYELDAYGRIAKVREFNNHPLLSPSAEYETYVTTYRYDTADQLVNITDAEGNVFAFGYDSLGRRVSLDDPDMGAWTYAYDLAGNLVSQTGGGGSLVTGDSYYREYNSLGQLVTLRQGNLSNGTIIEEYTYDAFGDRVKVWKPLENVTILTPFRELMRVMNSSGTYDYLYIYDGSTLVARKNPDGSKWFYHPDHLGSTTLITDESGNVVEETFYEPYGAVISGGTTEDKLYTGHYSDTDVGQEYLGARYRKPEWGIFIEPDSLLPAAYDPQQLNLYSYGRNNPYKFVDPSGNNLWDVLDVISVGISYKDYKEDPSLENLGWLALDVVSLLPVIPSVGLVRHADKLDEGIEVAEKGVKRILKSGDDATDLARAGLRTADPTDVRNALGKGVSGFNPSKLETPNHLRHMGEMGMNNPQQYEAAAKTFLETGGSSQTIRMHVRPNGDIVKYNRVTNEYAVVTKEGVIRTYFKPKGGMGYYISDKLKTSGTDVVLKTATKSSTN